MAIGSPDRSRGLTPFRITLIYVLVGGAWILFTDQLVAALPVSSAVQTQLQTAKGWLYVGTTGLLIYGLVAHSRRQLEATNDRLERTLQQSSVLHRVLRHNLRNVCNVIALRTEQLQDLARDGTEHAVAIQRRTDELLELGDKSRHLRDVVHDGQPGLLTIDLVSVVQATTGAFEDERDGVTVETDLPAAAEVVAYPKLEIALEELLENAVEHADRDEVTIQVAIRQEGTRVALDVADDGPGLPEMERDVLERGMEKPLSHSQGLGLWLVRVIVTESGGDLNIVDNEPRGTVVTIRLDAPGGEAGVRETV